MKILLLPPKNKIHLALHSPIPHAQSPPLTIMVKVSVSVLLAVFLNLVKIIQKIIQIQKKRREKIHFQHFLKIDKKLVVGWVGRGSQVVSKGYICIIITLRTLWYSLIYELHLTLWWMTRSYICIRMYRRIHIISHSGPGLGYVSDASSPSL